MSDHPRSATLHETSERGCRVWTLWAKIVVPVTGVLILGGITSACEDDTTATDVGVTAPEIDPSQTDVTIEPSSTVLSTTDVATTLAPTTAAAPTTTAAPVTVPPTPAPTAPPQTVAFVAPPPPTQPPAPATDPRFDTCKDAKANGFGPYSRGTDPEYNWYRDADSDGIVCE